MISYGAKGSAPGSSCSLVSAAVAVRRVKLSRREWLRCAGRFAASLPVGFCSLEAAAALQYPLITPQNVTPPPTDASTLFNGDPTKYRFTLEEDRLLDEVQRACFQFFWDEVNPYTGLVKDRSQAGGPDERNVASIAATGFGLTALCVADHRGWQDQKR